MPQSQANILISLLDHAYEVLLAIIKMECQRWPEKLSIWGQSGTQYVAMVTELLKVKCNEIWTIFLFSKNLREKVSCINRKQNQLLKISFVRIVAPKTRKSDDFRELHENEPEMAALGVETKL